MFFLVYRDSAEQWRWSLYAGNGKIIADSGEGYVNKADCIRAVELVRSASNAEIRIATN